MDTKALYKLSYGVYVVTSKKNGRINGQMNQEDENCARQIGPSGRRQKDPRGQGMKRAVHAKTRNPGQKVRRPFEHGKPVGGEDDISQNMRQEEQDERFRNHFNQ